MITKVLIYLNAGYLQNMNSTITEMTKKASWVWRWRLLGNVVARERADAAGAAMYADAPSVVIATHHCNQVSFA